MNRILVVFIVLLALGAQAWAQDAIGVVKTVSGGAIVIDADKPVAARAGTPVRLGSVLKTGPKGSMGVTFSDDTVMSFGPDTEVTVDEYLYAPSRGDLKFTTNISRGTLAMVSGVIAKLKPDAATVKTPTATIGVRGTRFVVKVER